MLLQNLYGLKGKRPLWVRSIKEESSYQTASWKSARSLLKIMKAVTESMFRAAGFRRSLKTWWWNYLWVFALYPFQTALNDSVYISVWLKSGKNMRFLPFGHKKPATRRHPRQVPKPPPLKGAVVLRWAPLTASFLYICILFLPTVQGCLWGN